MNAERWRSWSLTGLEVTQLRFDHQFHVLMWSPERELTVIYGAPFRYVDAVHAEVVLDPEAARELGPLVSLLHQPAASFEVSALGESILRFEDGSELRAAPDDRWESWESHGGGELADASLLCRPGGGPPWGQAGGDVGGSVLI